VDVIKSSGDSLFDRSAVQAVKKAEQFPEVKEMPREVFERFYRELNLVFRPQDLRQ
jgi:TonB family C-terminal domain